MPVLLDIDLLREVERAREPPRERLAALRSQALAEAKAHGLAQARASWRIVELQARAAGRPTALAFAALTIGEALERHVRALFAARRAALAVALDAVGNELLFALSRRVQDRIAGDARRSGLAVAGELRPGDPGLDLDAQPAVLAWAGAAAAGVTLGKGGMLHPAKSSTLVHGAGVGLPAQTWSRCDECGSRHRCTQRPAQ